MQFFSVAFETSSAALFGSWVCFTCSERKVFACGHVKRTRDPNTVAEEVAMAPEKIRKKNNVKVNMMIKKRPSG